MGAIRNAAQRRQGGHRERSEHQAPGQSTAGDGSVDSADAEAQDDATATATKDGDASRPELIDATQYDFDRLQRAIASLVAQQRALVEENEALRVGIVDRNAEVERLAAELRGAVERRKHALERVDALIDELDRLDSRLDDAMVDWVEGADEASAVPSRAQGTHSSPPG